MGIIISIFIHPDALMVLNRTIYKNTLDDCKKLSWSNAISFLMNQIQNMDVVNTVVGESPVTH